MLQRSLSGSSLLSSSSKPSTLTRSSSGTSLAAGVSKALKFFDRGVSGDRHANTQLHASQEESGYWRYVVIDPAGIRPRDDASYADHTKRRNGPRLREGTIVEVDRRRRAGWTQWLGLKSGEGWLFDVSPKDKKVRLIEVEVAEGRWQYEPVVERVPLLSLPCPRAASSMMKTSGACVQAHEVVSVNVRVRPLQMKGSFLHLADGRGWLMDFADGRQLMRRLAAGEPASPQARAMGAPAEPAAEPGAAELGEWDYVVVDPSGLTLRAAPGYAAEKVPRRVEEGEIVTAVERRPGDGTTFLRLESPQGWAFDTQPGSAARLRLVPVVVERGAWHYVVVCGNGVALRSRCCFAESSRLGPAHAKGAFLSVSERVRVGEATFLRVEGGWVPDSRQGRLLLEGPVASITPPPGAMMKVQAEQAFTVVKAAGTGEFGAHGLRYRCSPCCSDVDATQQAPWGSTVHGCLVAEDWLKVGDRFLPLRVNGTAVLRKLDEAGVRLLSAPTEATWAATKFFLLDKAQVQVLLLCQLEGTRWARVASVGGNMEGWVHQRLLVDPNSVPSRPGVQVVGSAPKQSSMPSSGSAFAPSQASPLGAGAPFQAGPLGAGAPSQAGPLGAGAPSQASPLGAGAPSQASPLGAGAPLQTGPLGAGAPLQHGGGGPLLLQPAGSGGALGPPAGGGASPALFASGTPTRVTVTAAPQRR